MFCDEMKSEYDEGIRGLRHDVIISYLSGTLLEEAVLNSAKPPP